MSIELIMKQLPQKYPFIMCDHITEYKYREFSKGYKNVSINEYYFQGHFPGEPVMPGVFILEAMAQIGGFIFLNNTEVQQNSLKGYIAGFDKVKFLKKVVPGDRLDVEAKYINQLGSLGKVNAVATVDGQRVATADISYKFEEN